MAKRFTDTDIWKNQRWFRKLKPLDKLAFCYIKDECNHAGIWKIDCSDLMEDLGLDEFDLDSFLTSVNTEFDKISGKTTKKERLVVVNKNFIWVTGFIQFQYENKEGKVNSEAAPVKSALQILEGFGRVEEGLNKGYITLVKGSVRAKDKDKDKVKDKGIIKKNTHTPGPEKKAFNTMPVQTDFNGLPDQYINASVELIYALNNKLKVETSIILTLWESFKIQNLTGANWYPNEGKVYSHFINTIKKEKFKHGQPTSSTVGKQIKFDKP